MIIYSQSGEEIEVGDLVQLVRKDGDEYSIHGNYIEPREVTEIIAGDVYIADTAFSRGEIRHQHRGSFLSFPLWKIYKPNQDYKQDQDADEGADLL